MQKSVLKGLQWLTGIVIFIALLVSFVGYDRITSVLNFSDCNYKDLKEVLMERDSRNTGLDLKVCKKDKTLIIDMVSIAGDKSRTDVFRYILQAADELKAERFERVEFAYLGNSKFYITGSYFQKLGSEYEWQNAIFTSRTFPENVKNMDGTDAFDSWLGSMFGVLEEQMGSQNKFHDQWYMDELKEN